MVSKVAKTKKRLLKRPTTAGQFNLSKRCGEKERKMEGEERTVVYIGPKCREIVPTRKSMLAGSVLVEHCGTKRHQNVIIARERRGKEHNPETWDNRHEGTWVYGSTMEGRGLYVHSYVTPSLLVITTTFHHGIQERTQIQVHCYTLSASLALT
jgi:hypothetical protein